MKGSEDARRVGGIQGQQSNEDEVVRIIITGLRSAQTSLHLVHTYSTHISHQLYPHLIDGVTEGVGGVRRHDQCGDPIGGELDGEGGRAARLAHAALAAHQEELAFRAYDSQGGECQGRKGRGRDSE